MLNHSPQYGAHWTPCDHVRTVQGKRDPVWPCAGVVRFLNNLFHISQSRRRWEEVLRHHLAVSIEIPGYFGRRGTVVIFTPDDPIELSDRFVEHCLFGGGRPPCRRAQSLQPGPVAWQPVFEI